MNHSQTDTIQTSQTELLLLYDGKSSLPSSFGEKYILEMPHEKALPVEVRQQIASNSDSVSLLLLFSFLIVSLSFRSGYKLLFQRLRYLFNIKERNSIFSDSTMKERKLRFSLMIQLFIFEGITIYYVILQKIPEIGRYPIFYMILCAILLAAVYFYAQLLIYKFVGYVFTDKTNSGLWVESFRSVNILLSCALLPLILILIYFASNPLIILYVIGGVYVIGRIIFLFIGVKIFFKDIYGIIYFILYLCALEITPLFLLYKGAYFLYNFVELRLV